MPTTIALAAGSIVAWDYAGTVQLGLVEAVYRDGNLRLRPLDRPHRTIAKPATELRLLWTLDQMSAVADPQMVGP